MLDNNKLLVLFVVLVLLMISFDDTTLVFIAVFSILAFVIIEIVRAWISTPSRRDELVQDTPVPPVSRDCINEEDVMTFDPIQKPAMQMPPGYCFGYPSDTKALDWTVQNKRNPYTNEPMTPSALHCLAQWRATGRADSATCKSVGARLVA